MASTISLPTFPSPPISFDSNSPTSILSFKNPNFPSRFNKRSYSTLCCPHAHSSDSPLQDDGWWTSPVEQLIRSVIRKFNDFVNSRLKDDLKAEVKKSESVKEDKGEGSDVEEWDWERWKKHFKEVEEQEHLISILESQLNHAINKEDYDDAARIKVAIAAMATNDTVGCVLSSLRRAVQEERYGDAAFVRDNAGAGLVGWWAGVSSDKSDPYGCIIRISAEHGRYVARRYSPRHLATSTTGVPLFEIFLTWNKKGEYKQQAVYLRRTVTSQSLSSVRKLPTASSDVDILNHSGSKTDIFGPTAEDIKDSEDQDDIDATDVLSGFQNILQDMVPGVHVKVLKVTASGEIDRDLISKVIEQIMDEDEEEEDKEAKLEGVDTEDRIKVESDEDKDSSGPDAGSSSRIINEKDQSEFSVKVVVGGLIQKLSGLESTRSVLRVPAKLERKGRKSFSFCIEDDQDWEETGGLSQGSPKRKSKVHDERTADHVMSDLFRFVSRGEKVPIKVLKDVGDLLSLTLTQAQNRQPLSRLTTFHRIELPAYPDPLNGLYIGSNGPFTSEVIQLKRKFGQWQADGAKAHMDLEFYEYVEAVKLTGDPYVPAGEVAFRAKVGKRYQLPHKGIIPEEFGVIARYKGQGRLAGPGFQNPRWVDGELVILDGKVFYLEQYYRYRIKYQPNT